MGTENEIHPAPILADIPLLLIRPVRHIASQPSGIPAGLITLRAWEVDPVPRLPPDLAGFEAYLIRIGYDLDVAPDAARPQWFEIGFTFAVPGMVVHDALPQEVGRADKARSYALNGKLAFARQDGPIGDAVLSDIQLPAVAPEILMFGRGSSGVRWRHTGTPDTPVRPGSRTGWIVLLAPPGQRQALVRASASFALPAGEAGLLRERDWPDAFAIDLPGPETAGPRQAVPAGGPRVFVTYTHDSADHKKHVAALCGLLADAGIRVTVDQNEPSDVRRDWSEWMTTGIHRAGYVVAIASPAYRSVGLSEFGDRVHGGAQAEYRLLMSLLRENRSTWLPRILPVILPGHTVDEIPVGFQPYDADHYHVPRLDAAGIAELVGVIRRPH